MNHEEFGTADDYAEAFQAVKAEGLHPKHVALLRAHFAAPEHTATWAQLAEAVGYVNGNAVNLQYGMLASRVAQKLGLRDRPQGFWLYVLAGWAEERDPDSAHTAYVLRRPVIEALARIGIVPDAFAALLPDELPGTASLREGARCQVLVNSYERNAKAKQVCIEHYGTSCSVCGFSFGTVFGELGRGFIHVHHLVPISSIGGEYCLDPIADLRPVCPNCHAMLHREDPPLSIENLRAQIQRLTDGSLVGQAVPLTRA